MNQLPNMDLIHALYKKRHISLLDCETLSLDMKALMVEVESYKHQC